MKTLALCAAAAAALSVAPAAFAEDPQAVITYDRAELASEFALNGLRAEIRQAANDVCIAPAQPTLAERRARNKCRDAAIADAEAQLEQTLAELGNRQFAAVGTLHIAAEG